jgi:SET domain-containing protein
MKSLIQNTSVNQSSIHGWGVFANKTIRKGGIIEECPYIETTAEEKHPAEIQRYLFSGQKKDTTMIILGYGGVYNHSQNYNADFFFDDEKNVIVFVGRRKINKGEEIFIDYGRHYWDSRKRIPR